jgi:hypothetical protein
MLSPEGEVRILDFGIGCLLAETEGESLVDTMSTANSISSGLDCASPESIMDPSNLTPAGDQYSLGCVLYFCVTGRYPFPEGTAVEKMMCHQHKEPTPIKELAPGVPAELVAIIERLMQKSPEARYATTTEVVAALRAWAQTAPAPPPVRVARPAVARPARPARAERPAASTPAPNGNGHNHAPARPRDNTPPPPTKAPAAGRGARGGPAAPGRQALANRAALVPPVATPAEPQPPKAFSAPYKGEKPRVNLEERLGPIGIAVCAILACLLVWFLTYRLF